MKQTSYAQVESIKGEKKSMEEAGIRNQESGTEAEIACSIPAQLPALIPFS